MALKKKPAKAVKSKKSAPKKSKVKTPCVIHKGNENKTKSLEEIKEMLKGAPPTTHVPVSTSCSSEIDARQSFIKKMIGEDKKDSETDNILKELKLRVKKLESELQHRLPDHHGYEAPISISIMNVSQHTLKDVSLFNDEYKNQDDVVYKCMQSKYSDVLKFKNAFTSGEKTIGSITLISENNHKMTYVRVNAINKGIDGSVHSVPISFMLDSYQNQSCILDANRKIPYDVGMDLVIDSLPPMQRFTYHIFLIKESELTNQQSPITPQP